MSEKTLRDVANTVYLNKDNTVFFNMDGYITMQSEACGKEKTADPDAAPQTETKRRVLLHRLFPYDETDSYISVLDTDQNELGMILSLDDFDGESRAALESELVRKYFIQHVYKILEIKDRHGFTYWRVISDGGRELEFTLHDTYRSIFRVGDGRLIITDVDGNRYGIENVSKLDAVSYKRIELYL